MSEQDPPARLHFPERLRKITEEQPSSFLLAGLLVLAVLYTLYFARAVLLPIVLASLLALILMPAVRALKRLHVPRGLGAALVVVALTGSLVGLGGWIYDPAAQWIDKAPSTLAEVERKMRGIKKSVAEMAKVATDDWNHVHLIIRGNTLIHIINNQVMSVVIDDDAANRTSEGQIGVQVHVGPPMKVEYRNIRLKAL